MNMNLYPTKKITLVSDRSVDDFMDYFSKYIDQSGNVISFGWKHLPFYGLIFGNTFEINSMSPKGRVNRTCNVEGTASPNGSGTRIDFEIIPTWITNLFAMIICVPFLWIFFSTFVIPTLVIAVIWYFIIRLATYVIIKGIVEDLVNIVEEKYKI